MVKKYIALLGAGIFGVICFSLYLMMETVGLGMMPIARRQQVQMFDQMNERIKSIQLNLDHNKDTVNEIRQALHDFSKGDKSKLESIRNALQGTSRGDDSIISTQHSSTNSVKNDVLTISNEMCQVTDGPDARTDVQMLDVFEKMPFNNQNGGVWKQGWPITYDVNSFEKKPLQVFVVPHSHTDPGWLKTFDKYYMDQTRHILNNMVQKLEADSRRKFMYAEISFFSKWWKDITPQVKERVKKLIKNGQFEMVTAGWVMTDEANAHYYAMLDQLIEGQNWLYNELGIIPTSGWAIDPFGHSSTMAYLLKRMGFKNMLIQRTHYEVKKHLAHNKQLEFMWRQNWDTEKTTDMFCHMMPFYSYDVPHTCGPDPKICCQFDFKRLPGGRITCPWKIAPVPITNQNVAQKAEILLDQYRKKAQLYKNNVVLVILGDDFRYDKPIEWDQQFGNYQKLFDYMNSRKEWNVQAQFGTLSDYFNGLYARAGVQPGQSPPGYPSLSGDFFTYTDRDDDYWSGYYTSRPFYKNLDRVLESKLRASEIMFSLAVSYARHHGLNEQQLPMIDMKKGLVYARRGLGLFQHHDGITGTAKDFVVRDYGERLIKSYNCLQELMQKCVDFLATKNKQSYKFSPSFSAEDIRKSHDSLPTQRLIKLTDTPRSVVFYNSLAQEREELIKLIVDTDNVIVRNPQGDTVPNQINLVWLTNEDTETSTFQVVFAICVPALGLSTYTIQRVDKLSNQTRFPVVTMYNSGTGLSVQRGNIQIFRQPMQYFYIENSYLKVDFSRESGLMEKITWKNNKKSLDVNMEFVTYGTRNSKDRSGAYLFMPNGEAKLLHHNKPFIRVIRGDIFSEVHVFLPHVEHVVRIHNSPGADSQFIEVFNIVDITNTNNFELAMRIKTGVQSDDVFFTDLNGYQILKRKTFKKLPLQANFYPMPQMAYIQDEKIRFSILSAQSLGVSSLKSGWLEVMLDRRLNQDDNRGLQQGVLDNKRTPNTFRFLFEDRKSRSQKASTISYPSAFSHTISLQLIYPINTFITNRETIDKDFLPNFLPLTQPLPCELHLVNLRTLQNKEGQVSEFIPKDDIAMIVHRLGFDCAIPSKNLACKSNNGMTSMGSLFRELTVSKFQETSLNLLYDGPEQLTLQVSPMEIKAYKILLK